MSRYLPGFLLSLFRPRPQLPQIPKEDLAPESHERTYAQPLSGIAAYVSKFEDPKDAPPAKPFLPKQERRAMKQKEAEDKNKAYLEKARSEWNPETDPNTQGDAYKTLFVGRLSYDVTEDMLRKEMEEFGPVNQVSIVRDKITGKPRGYAFVEFEHERDMRAAYRYADGMRVNGRRIVVDFERGRTVDGWYPRRLGGGLGGTRIGGPDQNVKASGRYDPNRQRRVEERQRRYGEEGRTGRSRERSRSRDHGRDRDRDRSRERRSHHRSRSRDRDRDRDRGREHRRRDRRSRSRERRSSRYDRY